MHEKQQRIRYIRVLEKFFTRTVSLLKLENFDEELFKQRTLKNYEDLKRVEAIDLNSKYFTELIAFINKTLQIAQTSSENFENERTTLLKEANLLQKEKNRNSYKKDKHKNSKFDDGY
ncbi:hypothetical protein [Halarcobacter ebronensis]|uniref:Uncharacterized protein n=1 Tax=Halarcobacter ebronensis TaxID=1462615 RepID=A0A4Q1ANI7_9BACT|nr:hypothetical protein [Halarcobacter ebronensis]QKF82263.1 hypothetical protein AEBR_1782 [Halarcobacter ebronensis]RXK07704.1 hypothetical protein CRV07_04380 [Halarcobacter ebronensis]